MEDNQNKEDFSKKFNEMYEKITQISDFITKMNDVFEEEKKTELKLKSKSEKKDFFDTLWS